MLSATLPRAAAAALLATLLLPAAGARAQVNLNELTGDGGAGQGAGQGTGQGGAEARPGAQGGVAVPDTVQAAERADIPGLESAGTWYKVNNAGTNFATSITLGEGELRATRILVFVSDVEWRSGTDTVRSVAPYDDPAGEGWLFPQLPPYALVVWQPANRIAFQIDAISHTQPNLLTMQTDDPIKVLVNDRNTPEGYGDNSGAFDFYFRFERR